MTRGMCVTKVHFCFAEPLTQNNCTEFRMSAIMSFVEIRHWFSDWILSFKIYLWNYEGLKPKKWVVQVDFELMLLLVELLNTFSTCEIVDMCKQKCLANWHLDTWKNIKMFFVDLHLHMQKKVFSKAKNAHHTHKYSVCNSRSSQLTYHRQYDSVCSTLNTFENHFST